MEAGPSPAVTQVFATAELLALVLSNLLPPRALLEQDGQAADDPQSSCIRDRCAHLGGLLQAQRVGRNWRHVIRTDKLLREALFLSPSMTGSTTRGWTVPRDAPWRMLNRDIVSVVAAAAVVRGAAASRDDGPLPEGWVVSPPPPPPPPPASAIRRYGGLTQKYPGRPWLNPLLQRYLPDLDFRFIPIYDQHAARGTRHYNARFTLPPWSDEMWTVAGLASGKDHRDDASLPSWWTMQLSSPPVMCVDLDLSIHDEDLDIFFQPGAKLRGLWDEQGWTLGRLLVAVNDHVRTNHGELSQCTARGRTAHG